MFGLGKRIKNWIQAQKLKALGKVAPGIALVLITLGETTIDTSQMTQMIQDMLPLIIAMISLAIPLIFIKYIMRFIEKILSGFG